jgi:hypothetical protein
MQDTLNDFISDGQNMAFGSESNCRTFDATNPKIQNNAKIDIIILEWKMSKCNYRYWWGLY